MRQEIKTRELAAFANYAIDTLGGDSAVAALFRFKDMRRVWNWRKRGLPPHAHAGMGALLARYGVEFSPELFRQYSVDHKRYREYLDNGK